MRPTSGHVSVAITVNGSLTTGRIDPRMTLVDYIREHVRLTGTHVGCEQGACGACTLHVSGYAVRSCLMLAVQADGQEVRTVESLEIGGEMSDLQAAFLQNGAAQCGFCTAGFLMLAEQLLDEYAGRLDDSTARTFMAGNICRCTGYTPIIASVLQVAAQRARADESPDGPVNG